MNQATGEMHVKNLDKGRGKVAKKTAVMGAMCLPFSPLSSAIEQNRLASFITPSVPLSVSLQKQSAGSSVRLLKAIGVTTAHSPAYT